METVSSTVGPRNVPGGFRSLSPMGSPDYVDLFTLSADGVGAWSAERWTRTMFDDVVGTSGQVLFRVLLGLRLGPRRAPERVAGWAIDARGEDWVRLAARSWCMTCHLVVRVEDGAVSLVTFMNYDRRAGSWIWTPMSTQHRRLAPGLLQGAHRLLARGADR